MSTSMDPRKSDDISNGRSVSPEVKTELVSLNREFHWQAQAEQMNERFKSHYGFDYPVNGADLIDLVVKKVIRDIKEARDFVIREMQGDDFLKSCTNPRLAIFELEQALAVQRKVTCDLPQYQPGQSW